jgi:apolipoprotein D and lipocalin family protein
MKLQYMLRIVISSVALLVSACGGNPEPLPVVERVDLERYTGTWHEIARLPQWFQRGCYNATAEYSLNDDGSLKVVNRCEKVDDEPSRAEGRARVVKGSNNAKLKVRFDNWFSRLLPTIAEGNYWIIHLSEAYDVVMIGEPEREYLWILARQPELPDQRYEKLVARAKKLGFPVDQLKRNRNLVPGDGS